MSSAVPNPRLRLVANDDVNAVRDWADTHEAVQEVREANQAAAIQPGLDPTDPRWVLAVRAYSQLQGGVLTPERREKVMRLAHQLGVQPFDANIVIALTQDQARRGGHVGDAARQIALIGVTPPKRSSRFVWWRWISAVGCALIGAALLIRWLVMYTPAG